jgi:hypothetical protein
MNLSARTIISAYAPESQQGRSTISIEFVYKILIVLAVFRLWVLRFGASFWSDEAGTYWVVKDGPAKVLDNIHVWPTQSVIYCWLMSIYAKLTGPSEILLRLPSLLFMCLSLWLLYRLTIRIAGYDAALPTLLVFTCLLPVGQAAADFRQYGLAFALILGSTVLFVEWLDTGRPLFAFAYVACAALIPYTQPLFVAIYIAHALYFVAERNAGKRPNPLIALGIVVSIAVLLIPAVLLTRNNTAVNPSLNMLPTSLTSLAGELIRPEPFAAITLGLALALLIGRIEAPQFTRLTRSGAVLLLACWIVPICFIFIVTVLTPFKIFVPRYYLPETIGLAMAAGYLISSLRPLHTQRLVACTLLGFLALAYGGIKISPLREGHDWRGALAAVRRITAASPQPLLMPSPFIEGAQTKRLSGLRSDSFLYSQLTVYPAGTEVEPLPYDAEPAKVPFLEDVASRYIARRSNFLLLQLRHMDVGPWFETRMRPAGFRVDAVDEFGNVRLYHFVFDHHE